MTALRRTVCSSCSELIYWVVTEHGKAMPIDVEPVEGGNLLLAAGETPPRVSVVSTTGQPPGMKLYVSHFATCRDAQQHRKRPAPAQPRPKAPRTAPQAALFSDLATVLLWDGAR